MSSTTTDGDGAMSLDDRRKRDEARRRDIGERLAEARMQAGMKQRELAELMGVSERTIHAHESGEVSQFVRLKDYSRFLGRPVAWFAYGQEGEPSDVQLSQLRELTAQVLEANLDRNEKLESICRQNARIIELLEEIASAK